MPTTLIAMNSSSLTVLGDGAGDAAEDSANEPSGDTIDTTKLDVVLS